MIFFIIVITIVIVIITGKNQFSVGTVCSQSVKARLNPRSLKGGGVIIFFPSYLGEGHNFYQDFLGEGHNLFKVVLLRK